VNGVLRRVRLFDGSCFFSKDMVEFLRCFRVQKKICTQRHIFSFNAVRNMLQGSTLRRRLRTQKG
jgi:hypothetical protein